MWCCWWWIVLLRQAAAIALLLNCSIVLLPLFWDSINQINSPPSLNLSMTATFTLPKHITGHGSSFSALTGEGVKSLQYNLIERLESGPYYYPPDLVTDQPERFIIGELIREQILLLTRQEVPHSVAITVEKIEETPTITRIFAAINVERDSQKGIIIGKKGSMLKTIGTQSRQQIQKLIAGDVYLQLFVKVQPKWRHSRLRLAEFGYRLED